MAQKVNSGTGIARESRRLAQSLQRSNKLLSEASEELRQAAQARDDFMAKMSHEWRTPLNVIIGFAELMLDEMPGEINEEQRRNLNDILSSGRRLLSLVNDMLETSEIESGKEE
jgi:signal transduction histidine kinase